MDLIGSLLTFTMLWKLSSGLQCYICDRCPDQFNSTIRQKFLKDCPKSTMCFKRVSTLDFGNGLVSQNSERGCAPQTLEGDQKKINGKWVQMKTIYEVYEEKCSADPSNLDRRIDTVICYCRGDQCNRAGIARALIGLVVIMVAIIGIS